MLEGTNEQDPLTCYMTVFDGPKLHFPSLHVTKVISSIVKCRISFSTEVSKSLEVYPSRQDLSIGKRQMMSLSLTTC